MSSSFGKLRMAAVLLALLGGAACVPAMPAAAQGWHHRGWPGGWHDGYWHHGWYGGRMGWWWVAGGNWYWYNAPVYPYPGAVSEVYVSPPATVAPPPAAPAPQMWYYCDNPAGYYPYVQTCSQPFRPVAPSAPPPGYAAPQSAPQSAPPPPPPPPGVPQ